MHFLILIIRNISELSAQMKIDWFSTAVVFPGPLVTSSLFSFISHLNYV